MEKMEQEPLKDNMDEQNLVETIKENRERMGLDVAKGRKEKRAQQKFFLIELKAHKKRKPGLNMDETDPEKLQRTIFRRQSWAARYGLLVRKLDELGYGFEKDSERLEKRSVESGRVAQQQYEETGKASIDGVRSVSDLRTEEDGVSEK